MRFWLRKPVNDAERAEVKREKPKHSKLRNFAGALIVSSIMTLGGCGKADNPQNVPPDIQAFRPPVTGQVHKMPKKLVVLTRDKFRDSLTDYVDAKKAEGYEVKVVTLEEVPNTGRDVPESIRDYLMQEKENNGLDYLLIVGDIDHEDFVDGVVNHVVDKDYEVPARYVSVEGKPYTEAVAESEEEMHDSIFFSDGYYANFTGTWDTNGNGIYGEAGAMDDEFDLSVDVYVGRLPVQTVEELEAVITTTLNWEVKERPVYSIFDGKYCLPYYSDGERENRQEGIGRASLPEVRDVKGHTCYGDEGGDIAGYLNSDGADIVKSISHGWFHGIVDYTYEGEHYGYYLDYTSGEVNKPPIYHAYACLVGAIDQERDVLAERMLKEGKVVAFIGAARSHADMMFDPLNDAYLEHNYTLGGALFEYKKDENGKRVLTDKEKGNMLMFNLFGDPTLLISKKPKVGVSVPEAVEIDTYYPDVPVFLNAESAMNIRVKYFIASTELEVFNGYVPRTASFSFDHHLDSYLERYLETKLIADNDSDDIVSVKRMVFFNRHIVRGPAELDVNAGEETTIPVLVLYGNDESVTVNAEFYPGCYEDGCNLDTREHYTVFSGTFELTEERKLPVTFTMPENENPFVSGTGYGLPQIEFSCEGCSGDMITYVYYTE